MSDGVLLLIIAAVIVSLASMTALVRSFVSAKAHKKSYHLNPVGSKKSAEL